MMTKLDLCLIFTFFYQGCSKDDVDAILRDVVVPEFRPPDKKIVTDESVKKEDVAAVCVFMLFEFPFFFQYTYVFVVVVLIFSCVSDP